MHSRDGFLSTLRAFAAFLFCLAAAHAQTTQGLISGRLLHSITGRAVAGASITVEGPSNARAVSAADGAFTLLSLSPGEYRVRAEASGFQAQETRNLVLPVAGRLEIDFRLRPLSDVWEAGAYNSVFLPGSRTIVTFFGPDVDTSRTGSFEAQKGRTAPLESTVSDVVDHGQIDELPLQGRDVYAMLVSQSGVTSDGATARGLGLSANGQRPAASNFLLDGVENNNYLTTGPLVPVAPEAIEEYRVSTNNFSAEYGRTGGFLANAITRAGTDRFHGTVYAYLKNDFLNANGFQQNRLGYARRADKEIQSGFVVTGPILRDWLSFSSAFEYYRSRTLDDPTTYTLPGSGLLGFASSTSGAAALLTKYLPTAHAGTGLTGKVTLSPPISLNRLSLIERVDAKLRGGLDHLTARVLAARLERPDFIWTPYPDFVSALNQDTVSAGGSYTRRLGTNWMNDARVSYSRDDLGWNRPHPELPTLATGDGVTLPGSPAAYEYSNLNRTVELVDNLIWTRGSHVATFGSGLLLRGAQGALTASRDGELTYDNIVRFAQDRPSALLVALDRSALPSTGGLPNFDRTWRYTQGFLFAQDTWRLAPRLTLNFGLRYEVFGGATNTGSSKDLLVRLGQGPTLATQIASASLTAPSPGGNQQVYGTQWNDFAPRVGASYDLTGKGSLLLRGSYGIFYDRPYDNLWQNVRTNSIVIPTFTLTGTNSPTTPVANLAPAHPASIASSFPALTLVDPNLKNGRVHSYFAGVEKRFGSGLTAEVNALGSYGRNLISTDIVNRDFTFATGRPNPNLPDISYRGNQGYSDYNALAAVVRYRSRELALQAAYTWSHAIDNQSDALAGDFLNLTFASSGAANAPGSHAAFSRQYDPNADRGNADFDQRHNFVVSSHWFVPAIRAQALRPVLSGWTLGGIAAVRSGLPYSILGTSTAVDGGGQIYNNRPDLLNPTALQTSGSVAGGALVLNANALRNAAPSTLGNLGRNALASPGFYNLDLSLGRAVRLQWRDGRTSLRFRAEAFNVLNHTNLGTPDTLLTSPTFGVAMYGRSGTASGFPAIVPLRETPRQIQVSLRADF